MVSLQSSGDSIIDVLKTSVLYRYWKPACCLAWAFFISFEVFIYLDHHYNTSPICPYSDADYGYWYWFCFYAVGGGFLLTWVALAVKIIFLHQRQVEGGISSNRPKPHAPLYVAFNVVSMSTFSTILSLTGQMGICVDGMGGAYPAATWGEWMVCGPLPMFLTVTVIDKPELPFLELIFILSIFLCLLFAFLIIPDQPYELCVFWLVMSCIAYLPGVFLPIYTERDRMAVLSQLTERDKMLYQEKFAKRTVLARLLTTIFAFVVLNYFIAIFDGYHHSVTIIVAQALSVLLKGPFSAMTMDVHADSLLDAQQALLEEQLLNESRANEARRSFMKYIFHEVRTPLNSLTMGIDLLSSSTYLSEEDREYLAMMKASSEFMADTLDDVLSMHKIEEGKLQLEIAPFSIRATIARVVETFRGSAFKKNLSLSSHVAQETPEFIVGDMHKVEHVIANFLSNAIKFTPNNKCVAIDVTCESFQVGIGGNERVSIKVSVRDEGIGISSVNQELLFQNFVQIRPSANQNGGGSGLGLSLVKNVVEMHSGTVGVVAKEGLGSTFFFVIPFDIWTGPDPVWQASTKYNDVTGDHVVINVRDNVAASKGNEVGTALQTKRPALRLLSPISSLQKVTPIPQSLGRTLPSIGGTGTEYEVSMHPTFSRPQQDNLLVPLGTIRRVHSVAITERTEAVRYESYSNKAVNGDGLGNKSHTTVERDEVEIVEASQSPLVLVVDDAELTVKMMSMLLKRLGVICCTAFDGAEALRLVTADVYKYQLVLMDNIMPEVSGVQAAASMRQQGYPNIIVGITGNVLEEDVEEYLKAGANYVLPKPLRELTLKRLLTFVKDQGCRAPTGSQQRIICNGDRLQWV